MIVLSIKPRQDHFDNIEDFIWKNVVSYSKLNSITKPFGFPIPWCDDIIAIIIGGYYETWIIVIDKHQG